MVYAMRPENLPLGEEREEEINRPVSQKGEETLFNSSGAN
jgi:hypothetical protein